MSAKVCLQSALNSQEKRILILPRLNWNTVFCATAVAWFLCWHSNSLQPHPRSVTNICCVCNNNCNVIGSCTGYSRPPPSPFLISSVVVNSNKEIYRNKVYCQTVFWPFWPSFWPHSVITNDTKLFYSLIGSHDMHSTRVRPIATAEIAWYVYLCVC